MGEGDTLLNAVIGAVVTVVLSFTTVSPILGGAVAGYLQQESRRDGARVGAISGGIAFLPFILLVVFFFGVFGLFGTVARGPMGPGMMGGGVGLPGAVELVIVFLVLFPLVIAWNVGLGALVEDLGVVVREEFGSRAASSAS
jgi:hypothetical protein